MPTVLQAQDNIHTGDGNIVGNICVGDKCDGFDDHSDNFNPYEARQITVRSDIVRLLLSDTSTATNFPTADFMIEVNGIYATPNFGRDEYFAIRNAAHPYTPFKISAFAGPDAFHIGELGKIGFNTDDPQVDLHLINSLHDQTDEAVLRLQTALTPMPGDGAAYDIKGSRYGFSVFDTTTDSTPFEIARSVRDGALFIADAGRIGFGTKSPEEALHIIGRDGESTSLMLENTGVGGDGDGRWEIVMRKSDCEFAINDADTPGGDFIFTGPSDQWQGNTGLSILNPTRGARWDVSTRGMDGDFTINDDRTHGFDDFIFRSSATQHEDGAGLFINGKIMTTGSCSLGCDAVFDEGYDLPTIEEHATEMFSKKHLPTVGPTQSGQIDLTQKVLTMLNELEKAHIYIAELNEEKKALEQALKQQSEQAISERDALLKRVEAIESRLN